MKHKAIAILIGVLLSAFILTHVEPERFLDNIEGALGLDDKVEISEKEFEQEFMEFIAEYAKSYANSFEFNQRFRIFKDNYQQIVNHNLNEEEHGFSVGINEFADLTLEEFKKTRLGLKGSVRVPQYKQKTQNTWQTLMAYKDLPQAVDWRINGTYVNPIKDQGSCGSCWAFSTIASIESAFAIKTGNLTALSEGQLVQCSKGYGNGGCSGGFMEYAFKYAEKYALCTEEEYPYEGKDSPACAHQRCLANQFKLEGFQDLEQQSRLSLYTGLSKQPVSIAVCAGSLAWQFYKKGVIKRFCGDCLDHGVVAVGYDAKEQYVIVRNSWGSNWGEKGYLRISSQDESGLGTCGIYQLPSVPIVG
jgi:hypothetical protein